MPRLADAPRIAVVGAYGNGKTTLSTILAERLGLRRTHGAPMREPSGIVGRSLEESAEPELIQLVFHRFTERAVGEAIGGGGFVSDGSVLHEWIYAKIRLVHGLHPAPTATLADSPRSRRTALYEEIVDQVGFLAREHARGGYDCFIYVAPEFPLTDERPPISEHFRTLCDESLLDVISGLGLPLYTVTGDVAGRTAQALGAVLSLTTAR